MLILFNITGGTVTCSIAKSKYMAFYSRNININIFSIDMYVNGDVVHRVQSADHFLRR